MRNKKIKAWAIINDLDELLWLEVAEEIERKIGITDLIFYAPAIFQRKKDALNNLVWADNEKIVKVEIKLLSPNKK